MTGLAGSTDQFRLLLESISDYAIYMLDLDGRVRSWNPAAERIKGYSFQEIEGQRFHRFFTPEDLNQGLPDQILVEAREQGRVEREGWRVRRDGTRFWALATVQAMRGDDGQMVGYAKITRDISARKRAEEALAQSERQFRLLVSGVVDYALYMLDPEGVVSNWNSGAEHIKGYTAGEAVGLHFSSFYTEADRAKGLPMRALEIARRDGRFESEGWRVRKDGTPFWASVVIDAIREDDGALVGFAKITRDITERRKVQMELQQARDRLAQAQKMEAIGQLTGGVAHDFNNLLMVVRGQAEILRTRVGEDPRSVRALDAIEMSATRGQDLTRHLLSFARRQRLRPATVNLADRSESLGELLSTSLGSSVALELRLPSDLWPMHVDISELELGLLNLAVNARDAMPGGGRLTISGQNRTLDGEVDGLRGDFIALSVSDTGQGMPADIQARVFEPFFTTKDVDKGTGLGLSQVYGFVEQSGGRVTLDSELGRGTTFVLYLPRSRGAVETQAAPEDFAAARRGLDILLVEDNPEVCEVAFALLEQLGARPRVATSARAALETLRAGPVPDLLFSDVVMAGELNGLDLARRVRSELPGLPVLLATGYSEAIRDADEFPIISKPYSLDELSRALALVTRGSNGSEGLAASAGEEVHLTQRDALAPKQPVGGGHVEQEVGQ